MEDFHDLLTQFKLEYGPVYAKYEALGQEIHEGAGPLPDKSRWLIKTAVSAACRHERSLETHIRTAQAAGATDEEITHTLLLLIPTAGFPTFMEAYRVYKALG